MKKEKYIQMREGKAGISYRVCYKNESKTFSEVDYGSQAYKLAIKYRNDLLARPYIKLARGQLVCDCLEELADFYNLRCETIRKYNNLFNKYMVDYASIKIDKLKKADIIECLNKMVDIASDDTIQRVFTIWKKIVYMANAKEYLYSDITFGIRPPLSHKISLPKEIVKIDKQLITEITSLLEKRIQLVYDRHMLPLIVWFLYFTGMRPCEALALTKNSIHDGIIDITCEIGSDRNGFDVIRPCKHHNQFARYQLLMMCKK